MRIGRNMAAGATAPPFVAKPRRREDDDEARLIRRIVGRDIRAFEELHGLYQPRLSRFLLNMVRRPEMAEEVLDDTLMVVWNRASTFDGSSRVSTWIFGIAYRTALSALRRRDEPLEDASADRRPCPAPDPERRLERGSTHAAIRSAMATLSADHRAVLDLTYFHELAYREIAGILDCPVDTVKTRMHHARRNLRRVLGGELADWM